MKILNASFLAPIKGPTSLDIKVPIQSITFRNAGTAPVILEGSFTIGSGETLHLNAVANEDRLELNGLNINFDTSVYTNTKLEILILTAKQSC